LLHFFLLPPLRAWLVVLIGGNVADNPSQTKEWNGIKKPPGFETPLKAVLSVSPNDEDRASLERIVKFNWTVIASATVDSALSVLREIPIPIVICDCDITSGTWEDMLDHISLLPDPPLLIVTSRLTDERLWAKAVNLGAWDVLVKPFDTEEVTRIVSFAWQHWLDRNNVYASRTKQRKSASGSRRLVATAPSSRREQNGSNYFDR
jgi:DNA-binding NtrC family response regulator